MNLEALGQWFVEAEGTAEGARLAIILALCSAAAHAGLGALQKGRHDPWLSRGAIDFWLPVLALPLALSLPLPRLEVWAVLFGAMAIHLAYKWFMAMAYERGAFTAVYPIVRGTAPLATVLFAGVVFGERYAPIQWAGALLLSGAIIMLGVINIRAAGLDRRTAMGATLLAALTGLWVAAYTIYDAWGIRLAENPIAFLAWFYVLEGAVFPWMALRRWRRLDDPPAPGPLLKRGLAGAVLAVFSFGAVMLATRLDQVGEAATLRETSVVFAGLFGWLFLRERIGPLRALLLLLVALGAVLVEAA